MKKKLSVVRVYYNKAQEFGLCCTGKEPGRAAYLCKSSDCLKKAQKSKGLERSFKRAVPPEIYTQLTTYMEAETL